MRCALPWLMRINRISADFNALAADTDGIDGRPLASGGVAGQYDAGQPCLRRCTGLDAAAIANNDSYSLPFLVMREYSPTRTNVNDFRVVLT